MKKCFGLVVVVFASIALSQASARSVREGVYTDNQAKRGQQLYSTRCANCHGDQLEGIEGAPALSGSEFLDKWSGQTVDTLFIRIQKSMPADHPGTLSNQQVADVLAYMLAQNSMPAGSDELPPDPDKLKNLTMAAGPVK